MAQVLKETQRNNILNAAKHEFSENGIKATSMRSIARKANMTVGNLYHYYSSKNDILNAVISPVITQLRSVSSLFLPSDPNILSGNNNFIFEEDSLKILLSNLADTLTELEDQYTLEMIILTNDEETNKHHNLWLYMIMQEVFKQSKPNFIKTQNQLEIIASMTAKAIFSGLREGFKLKSTRYIEKEEFRAILRFYILQSVFFVRFKEEELT